MKKSIKAVLFSGLIFPGVGQFFLKRYLRGLLFFAPAITSLVFMVDNLLRNAMSIVGQIELGDVPLDLHAISNRLSKAPADPELFRLNIALWILIACWVLSVLDSYRQGKIADQTDSE